MCVYIFLLQRQNKFESFSQEHYLSHRMNLYRDIYIIITSYLTELDIIRYLDLIERSSHGLAANRSLINSIMSARKKSRWKMACVFNRIDILQDILKCRNIRDRYKCNSYKMSRRIFKGLCKYNHLESAKKMHPADSMNKQDIIKIIDKVAKHDALDVIKWLIELYCIAPYNLQKAMCNACVTGRLTNVKYFAIVGCDIPSDALVNCLNNGHYDMAKYILEHAEIGQYIISEALLKALKTKNSTHILTCANVLSEYFINNQHMCMKKAAKINNVDLFQALYNLCDNTLSLSSAFIRACKYQNMSIMEWIYKTSPRSCGFVSAAIRVLRTEADCIDTIKWLYERKPFDSVSGKRIVAYAVRCGNIHVYEFMRINGFIIDLDNMSSDPDDYAITSDSE